MRLLASLHHYVATTTQGSLTVHQYATATITGADLTVDIDTDYPWDGAVTVRVTSAPAAESGERELALRIPAWSATAGPLAVELNRSPERFVVPPDSYLRLRRSWRPGDVLRLHLDLTPRWTYPDLRVDAVRGCVALERGPLVYCFEQTDQPARLDELAIFPGTPVTEQTVTLPGIGPTIQLTAPGWHFASNPAAGAASWSALPPAPIGPPAFAAIARPAVAPAQPVTLTAIPYFQWDNRGPGAMRVWIPAAHAGPPAP